MSEKDLGEDRLRTFSVNVLDLASGMPIRDLSSDPCCEIAL